MGQYDWVIGVAFSLASSFFSCLGLIFQKYAHMQNESLPPERKWKEVLGITCSPCWWASFLMMGLIPFPFDFFAFSFAAQSIVAPFAGLTLVMNQFLAPIILKEKIYRGDILASFVVFAGCSITTASGNHDDVTYTLGTLLDLYKEASFIISFCFVMGITIAIIIVLHFIEPSLANKKLTNEEGGVRASLGPIIRKELDHNGELAQPLDINRELDKSPVASGRNKGNASGGPQRPSTPSAVTLRPSEQQKDRAAKKKVRKGSIKLRTVAVTSCIEKARPFFYAFTAGAFGAVQNIFFKAVAVLMKAQAIDSGSTECWSNSTGTSRYYNTTGACHDLSTAKSNCAVASDCYGIATNNCSSTVVEYVLTQGTTTNRTGSYYKEVNNWVYALDRDCLDPKNPWTTSFYPYLFIVICLFFAVAQLSYLNKGMAHFKAILVFPLYNTCFLTLSVLMGAAYYQEFEHFKVWQLVAFLLGIFVTVLGVIMFIFTPRDPEGKGFLEDDEANERAAAEEPIPRLDALMDGSTGGEMADLSRHSRGLSNNSASKPGSSRSLNFEDDTKSSEKTEVVTVTTV